MIKVGLGKIELSRFSNGEARVWIKEDMINGHALVVQSLSYPPDENLIELCLICDALKRMGIKKVNVVVPYLGYSKQDKIFREGEPLSVKVIAKILQGAIFNKLIVFDLHNQAIVGFFDKTVIQLSAIPLFISTFSKLVDKDSLVVAPDAGSIKSSTEFAHKLNLDVVYIDKKRDLSNGKVTIRGISGDVKNKKVFLIDDMMVTGSTLIETANYLNKIGAEKIIVGVTHHLYLKGVQEKIEKSHIDMLYVTDTIEQKKKVKYKKLKVLSVAKIIAEKIKKL